MNGKSSWERDEGSRAGEMVSTRCVYKFIASSVVVLLSRVIWILGLVFYRAEMLYFGRLALGQWCWVLRVYALSSDSVLSSEYIQSGYVALVGYLELRVGCILPLEARST